MVQPNRKLLSGTVEVDEAFFGCISEGSPRRGADKALIVLAVEVNGSKVGRVRIKKI
jgi:hypothetical protein